MIAAGLARIFVPASPATLLYRGAHLFFSPLHRLPPSTGEKWDLCAWPIFHVFMTMTSTRSNQLALIRPPKSPILAFAPRLALLARDKIL